MTGLVCTDWQQTLSLPLLVTCGSKLVFLGDDGVTGVLLCVCMTERGVAERMTGAYSSQSNTNPDCMSECSRACALSSRSLISRLWQFAIVGLPLSQMSDRQNKSVKPTSSPKRKGKKSSYNFHPNAQSLANSSVIRCLQCPMTRMAVSCDI